MTGDNRVVVGKRLPSWNGQTRRDTLIALVLLLGVAWWVSHLVRGYGHLFEGDNDLVTIGGTIFFAIGLLVALSNLASLPGDLRKIKLESECPRCGAPAVRAFHDRKSPARPPTECGRCVAYLRADGDHVREESLDAFDPEAQPYRIWLTDRELPRDGKKRIKLAMPSVCATCGSSDAPHRREMFVSGGDDRSVIGSVIGTAAGEMWEAEVRSRQTVPTYRHRRDSPAAPSDELELRSAFDELRLSVCALHVDDEMGFVAHYYKGLVSFSSYRYYLEFLALNQLEGPLKESR